MPDDSLLPMIVLVAAGFILVVPVVGAVFLYFACKLFRLPGVTYLRCWKAYAAAYLLATVVGIPLLLVLPRTSYGMPTGLSMGLVVLGSYALHFGLIPKILGTPWLRTVLAQTTAYLTFSIVLAVAVFVPLLFYAQARAEAVMAIANLKTISLAMMQHYDAKGELPPAAIPTKDGKPLLSWRVALLPYLEQAALYREFKLDQPWDSDHNRALLPRMPRVFAPPAGATAPPDHTYYRVFVSRREDNPRALFVETFPTRLEQVRDGLSNTILVATAAEPVPWTKPDELVYSPKGPVPALGSPLRVLFADGSIRTLRPGIPEHVLRAFITADGDETIPGDWDR